MPQSGLPELMESAPEFLETIGSFEKMTEGEFENWALAIKNHVEWVDGRVVVGAPVSCKHDQLTGWIHSLLLIVVQHQRLGDVPGPEFMIRLCKGEKSRRVPDVLFVSAARRSLLKPTYLEGSPDVAIEVMSQDTVARDWREKSEGVREYWVVDPLSEQLEAYSLDDDRRFRLIVPGNTGIVASTAVPGFWLQPQWLWQNPLPDPFEVLRELGVLP